MANILELTNYSMTFYIYCLFSEDFRNTLLRTVKWPWFGNKKLTGKRNNDVSIPPQSNIFRMLRLGYNLIFLNDVLIYDGRAINVVCLFFVCCCESLRFRWL